MKTSTKWIIAGVIVFFLAWAALAGYGVYRLFKALDLEEGPKVTEKSTERDSKELKYSGAIFVKGTDFIMVPVATQVPEETVEYGYTYGDYGYVVNYLFISKAKSEKRPLLPKDAYIIANSVTDMETEQPANAKVIAYHIVLEDSNGDGTLNSKDHSFVGISNLDGNGFKTITPKERFVDFVKPDWEAKKIVAGWHDKDGKKNVIVYNLDTGEELVY